MCIADGKKTADYLLLNLHLQYEEDEIKTGGASANSDWSSSSLLVASRSLCLHSLLLSDRRSLPIA